MFVEFISYKAREYQVHQKEQSSHNIWAGIIGVLTDLDHFSDWEQHNDIIG